ncbi:penicillin-binding protein [Macrococcus hajekii]|uniref:Penicillin-binding protein n=1 Tax=Macrococcus hajekii TaxID=198482 RepID=A0A4R6BNB3_9STAP|nr:penicillin-binding protein [Macrococcus hajekii]TDM03281.1 penicillin-binding protein [Macrococcus hajekii]GGA97566.1 penicillin-binding protein [Macrococcus hajekii]
MAAIKIKKNKIGAVLLVLLFGLLFFLLIFRYSYVMLTGTSSGQDLVLKASEKYARNIINQPKRGNIYDRNGEVLAQDVNSYKLIAVLDKNMKNTDQTPAHVVDAKKTAKALAKIIDMPEKEIRAKLETKKAFQVEFGKPGRDLTYAQKKKIEALNMPGLTFFTEKKRFYPNGNFASHTIGFAEKNAETGRIEGMLGTEKIFDTYLSGKAGQTSFKQDIWQYVLPNSGNVEPAVDGDDVHLTIDKNIQIFVEDAMDTMVKQYKPKDVFAVVADAKTGEILGFSQRPTFNPETREGFGDKWQNDLFQNTYEPGSTFKTFGLAAAIQEDKFQRDRKYMSGTREVEGHEISDWNDVGWGEITMNKGFQLSSNVMMMKLQDDVGIDKMKHYYEKFGFGKQTGVLFDGEPSGQISWADPISQKVSSFGQSTTVTPVQMIQAETAILNEGKMLRPYYVQSVTSPDDSVIIKGSKKVVGQPISKETAKKTMRELKDVVYGSEQHAFNYQIDDYQIAGKTGTAQVADTENGGYVQGANPYFVSFMGYAPADKPKVIVYMGMSLAEKNDAEAYNLGVSKGYKPLMENILKYLDVTNPKKKQQPVSTEVPNVINQNTAKAVSALEAKDLEPVVLGAGDKVTATNMNGSQVLKGSKVFLLTDGNVTLPDMTGWSKRELNALETLTGITIKFDGSGYVVKQSAAAGTAVKAGQTVVVNMDSLDPLKQSPAYDQIIDAQRKDQENALKKEVQKKEEQKNNEKKKQTEKEKAAKE